MSRALKNQAPIAFKRPAKGLVTVKVDDRRGCRATAGTPKRYVETTSVLRKYIPAPCPDSPGEAS